MTDMYSLGGGKLDIEYLVLYFTIMIFVVFSLKRKDYISPVNTLCVDKVFSQLMKGIACLFILFGHYGQRKIALFTDVGFITKATWHLTANIGLVWFMFFSGYGLSLANIKNVFSSWRRRVLKVYLPLLFVSIISLILYFILPNKFSVEEAKILWLSPQIEILHSGESLYKIIPFLFGWPDWYVFCIIILYSIFYFSVFCSNKFHISQTTLLFIILLIYFICSYFICGSANAHWYRYIWCFMLGHLVARQQNITPDKSLILLSPFLLVIFMDGKVMFLSYFIGFYSLLIISIISKYYSIKANSPLLILGNISFFFYLSHVRIGYQIMTYCGISSVTIWILITIIISWIIKSIYDKIINLNRLHL